MKECLFAMHAINSITGQSMDVKIIVVRRPRETSWLISGAPHTVCLSLIKIISRNPEHISLRNCCYLIPSTTQAKTLSFLSWSITHHVFHMYLSHNFTAGEGMNSTNWPHSQCAAQLVEHRTGIREVTRSNPVEALIFLRLLPSNCLNYKFTAMITLHLPLIDHRKGFGIRAQISLWKSTLFLINPLRTCMAFDFMDNNWNLVRSAQSYTNIQMCIVCCFPWIH